VLFLLPVLLAGGCGSLPERNHAFPPSCREAAQPRCSPDVSSPRKEPAGTEKGGAAVRFQPEADSLSLPLDRLDAPVSEEAFRRCRARAANMMSVLYDGEKERGKIEEALRRCISLDPGNWYYYEKLGFLILKGGGKRKEEGYRLLEQAAEKGTPNRDVYYVLGERAEEKGNEAEMVRWLERFTGAGPSLAEQGERARRVYRAEGFSLRSYREQRNLLRLKTAYQRLLRAYGRMGKWRDYTRVLAVLAAEDEEYRVELARRYAAEQRFQEALKALNAIERVYELEKKTFAGYIRLYGVLLSVPGFLPGEVREGVYRKIYERFTLYLSLKGYDTDVLLAALDLCAGRGRRSHTVTVGAALVSRPVAPDVMARALLVLIRNRMVDTAFELLERAEKKRHVEITEDLAVLKAGMLGMLGRVERAERYVEKLAARGKQEGKREEIYAATAFFLADEGYYRAADALFTRCLAAEPGRGRYVTGKAYALYKLGEKEKAFSVLEEFLSRHGEGDPEIENLYGYLLVLENRDVDKAIRLIKRALEKEPNRPEYIDSLGWAYFVSGRMEKAGELLKAAARKGRNEEIFEHLGDFYHAVGDEKKAKKYWIESYLLRRRSGVREKIERAERRLGRRGEAGSATDPRPAKKMQ